jgi:hypothetical protein
MCVQVLGCREESLRKRLNFLRGANLSRAEVASIVTRCPQVLLLSVEENLWPKLEYLTQHMGRTAESLITCPVYLTLSLHER